MCRVTVANSGSKLVALDQTGGTKLDRNTAGEKDLENLPGIGPVLAAWIIAARLLKTADDLWAIKGIGAKIYEKIRPFFD